MIKKEHNTIKKIKANCIKNKIPQKHHLNFKMKKPWSVTDKLFKCIAEIKESINALQSESNKKSNDYLCFTEIAEQYPISKETLYRLKNDDLLIVSRLKGKSKFIVARKDIEDLIKNNKV